MALPTSGSISLSQIQSEFGGSNSISLSEYYLNGEYVTSNNSSVPSSGTISFNVFHGAEKLAQTITGFTGGGLFIMKKKCNGSFLPSGTSIRLCSRADTSTCSGWWHYSADTGFTDGVGKTSGCGLDKHLRTTSYYGQMAVRYSNGGITYSTSSRVSVDAVTGIWTKENNNDIKDSFNVSGSAIRYRSNSYSPWIYSQV